MTRLKGYRRPRNLAGLRYVVRGMLFYIGSRRMIWRGITVGGPEMIRWGRVR